jgi:adenosine deaminase
VPGEPIDADSERFQVALREGDISEIRRCAKADLHTHGVLSGDAAFVRKRTGREIRPLSGTLSSMAAMHEWVDANVGDVFAGAGGRALGLDAVFARAVADGVCLLALGDDVWMITQGLGSAAELTASIEASRQRIAPHVRWLPQIGISRHCPVEAVLLWLEPFLELGCFASVDLYGDELAQPIEAFAPVYDACRANGLRLTAHVGEWGSASDVVRAVDVLGLDAVQHGIAAADSPSAMRLLADRGVVLNVCPTSNVRLGRVEELRSHPIRTLFEAGVSVTVNTDDALVFGVGVSDEFLALHQAGVLGAAELDQIRCWGLQHLDDTKPASATPD